MGTITLRFSLFLAVNAFMLAGLYFWVSRKRWSVIDTFLGASLICLAQIFAVQMILAAIGHLRILETMTIHLLLSAGLWLSIYRDVPSSIKWTLQSFRSFCEKVSWFEWVVIAISAFAFIGVVYMDFYIPAFGWDGNMYHIPIAILRLQEGNLSRLDSAWSYIEGYPETGEMFILWNILFLGSQALADAVQWPFWILGTLAVISLALKMGAELPHAIAGSMIWTFAPVTLLQAQQAYNDLVVGALFWIGMNFVYVRPLSTLSCSVVGLASGLMIGTKLGSLGLVGILTTLTVWGIIRTSNKRIIIGTFIVWISFGLLNSYWYLSNWWHTGNPIWPVGLLMGPLVLKGPFSLAGYEQWYIPPSLAGKPIWQQLWTVWLETEAYYGHDGRLTGFGPLWFILGVPSVIVWSIWERRGWRLSLVSLLVILAQPLSWHTRYILYLPGLGGIALAGVLSYCKAPVRWGVRIVLMAGMIFSLLIAFDAYKLAYLWMPQPQRVAVYSGWPLLGGAYRYLDANTRAASRIVYGGSVGFLAPLWGEDLRHMVEYVEPVSKGGWESAVLAQHIEWAFVVVDSKEDEFLKNSSQFRLVVDDRRIEYPGTLRIRVYKLLK